MRSYKELSKLQTFEERFRYLQLNGAVGKETFGWDRYLNQKFYQFREWKDVRDYVIFRDHGCDLGLEGYEIHGRILVHHIEPATVMDIEGRNGRLLDPDNLVTVSHATHNAIHYGDLGILAAAPVERSPNDTCPWKR